MLIVSASAVIFALTIWTRAASPALSREELAATFDADMRSVKIEWDRGDTRPLHVRRKALFDFVYQTYDASAWIPQSLFDGNLVRQVIVGDVDTIVGEQVGLVLWRDNAACSGVRHGAERVGPLRSTFERSTPVDGELPRLSYG